MELTGKFRVKEIKKKTSAVFFKNLKVGDEFTLTYNLNGYYESAPVIDIYKDGEHAHHNNALQLVTNLEKFEIEQVDHKEEISNLLLKCHGQFATIDSNNMNEKFYAELDKEGIDIDDYLITYEKLSDHHSEGYQENKEESDNAFVKDTIADMKRLIEIAKNIK
ncbi:hypothetical protein P9294_gp011 [Bacillus phage FADO]|uniref:Uncharacterized protein n=1 Tax=Bacillus phage FADO TaxID=2917160 RepID=A0AAE9G9J3_9CAUD|nr:hypothetical protein P9294_gp011 [Bacillus phage FADO]UNY48726.1 hypothetical protein fado_11 [Bacillus phage FADO]